MAKQYNEKDREREELRADTPEQVNENELEQHAAHETKTTSGRTSGHQNKSGQEVGDTKADTTASKQPRSPRKRSQRPHTDDTGEHAPGGGSILRLPLRENGVVADIEAEQNDDTVVHELEAQGFTPDEALRLIHVSDRMAVSGEAREAEATLRRLRFTRWLIERGVLDEFSA